MVLLLLAAEAAIVVVLLLLLLWRCYAESYMPLVVLPHKKKFLDMCIKKENVCVHTHTHAPFVPSRHHSSCLTLCFFGGVVLHEYLRIKGDSEAAAMTTVVTP